MLDDAQAQGLILLREDPRSGTYLVSLAKAKPVVSQAKPKPAPRSRPRGGRGRRRPSSAAPKAAAPPAEPQV